MFSLGNERPEDKYLNKFVRDKICAACANNPEKWRDVGIQLMGQENAAKLDVIKTDKSDVTQRCSAMLSLWRQRQPKANWDQLIRALQRVDLETLADEINKLLKPSRSVDKQKYTGDRLVQRKIEEYTKQETIKGECIINMQVMIM